MVCFELEKQICLFQIQDLSSLQFGIKNERFIVSLKERRGWLVGNILLFEFSVQTEFHFLLDPWRKLNLLRKALRNAELISSAESREITRWGGRGIRWRRVSVEDGASEAQLWIWMEETLC